MLVEPPTTYEPPVSQADKRQLPTRAIATTVTLIILIGIGSIVAYAHFRQPMPVLVQPKMAIATMDTGMTMQTDPYSSATPTSVATVTPTYQPTATPLAEPIKITPPPTFKPVVIVKFTPTPTHTPTPTPTPVIVPTQTPTPASTATPSASHYSIAIAGFAFSPANITVKTGDNITWTNQDSTSHTVTSDNSGPLVSGNLAQAAKYSHTFASSGTFSYKCAYHSSMIATVTVQ